MEDLIGRINFKAGDHVIMYNNVGPAMTVVRKNKVGNYICQWHEYRKGLKEKTFAPHLLKLYVPPKQRITYSSF